MHLCRLWPEGSARAHWTGHPSPGELALRSNRNPTPADSNWSSRPPAFTQGRDFPWNSAKQDWIGKVQDVQLFLLTDMLERGEVAIHPSG
jgi:hypothetical protein